MALFLIIHKVFGRIIMTNLNQHSTVYPICTYTAGLILLSMDNNSMLHFLISLIIIFLSSIIMAKNIWCLPSNLKLKCAVWELLFCITQFCIVSLSYYILGNVISSILNIVICLIYVKKINPRYTGRRIL